MATAEIDAKYWLKARDKPGLLMAMMRLLAGEDARISFEGNLSGCGLAELSGASIAETASLRRATTQPELDFVVLPLDGSNARAILECVHRAGRAIIHIQIEKHGSLQFGAYDNFHPDCIVVGPEVSKSALDELVSKGVLKSVERAEPLNKKD